MRRTHLSLYYLAGYLLPAGVALLVAPEFARKLLLSNGTYEDPPFRLAGLVLIALGIVIVQIIRHRLEVLYPTTLVVRAIILAGLLAIYAETSDPFFLVLVGIVGFGFLLTGSSYLRDRQESAVTR